MIPSITPRQGMNSSGGAGGATLAPAPAPKPITQIVTSKTWVLPPRPKPGRKPSSDVPTTKRKAQNRAAQRAFRERRANRVTELEKQLMEIERDKSVKEGILNNTIKTLQHENRGLQRTLRGLKDTVTNLTNEVQRLQAELQLATPPERLPQGSISSAISNGQSVASSSSRKRRRTRAESYSSSRSSMSSPERSDLAEAASAMLNFKNGSTSRVGSISASPHNRGGSIVTASSSGSSNVPSPAAPAVGVARDSPPVHVKQEEDQLAGLSTTNNGSLSDLLDSFKPMAAVPLKRASVDTAGNGGSVSAGGAGEEMDFTTRFKPVSFRRMPVLDKSAGNSSTNLNGSISSINRVSVGSAAGASHTGLTPRSSITPRTSLSISALSANNANYDDPMMSPDEKCGFCSEDSPCVCREIAKEKEKEQEQKQEQEQEQKKEQERQRQKAQSRASAATTGIINTMTPAQEKEIDEKVAQCTGNPGTCPQCQKDPMSTLFCTTLAATSKVSDTRQKPQPLLPAPEMLQQALVHQPSNGHLPSLVELELSNPGKHYVPCADAYRTLSRHANFRRAGFNKIINNLNTNGMFVEVESIVKCLRQLDRKFGSN